MPIEPGSGVGCVGALIEQEHLREVIAQARTGLVVGTWYRAWSADRDSGGLGDLGDRRIRSVADDVEAAGRVVFQNPPEEVTQVRDVNRRPVLLPRAEHDQVAGFVSGRTEQEPGNASAAVAVRDAGHDHDSAHAVRVEDPTLDRLLPRDQRRCVHRGLLGDGGVGTVDPLAADVEVGLAGAAEGLDRRIDHCGVQVRAGLVAGAGRVDGPVHFAQQAHERRPVVELLADDRRDLVTVLLQCGQHMRSDEAGCARQCDSHVRYLLVIDQALD